MGGHAEDHGPAVKIRRLAMMFGGSLSGGFQLLLILHMVAYLWACGVVLVKVIAVGEIHPAKRHLHPSSSSE